MQTIINIPLMKAELSGRGEPLVLVPGGLTGWISWVPHAEALADSHRVIRLQLLNVEFGLSGDPLPPGYSVDLEVTALHKTLDHLAIRQADIAGWSYGAQIALSFALHHADRVRSLTLIEPGAYWVLRGAGGPELPHGLIEERNFLRTLSTDQVSEEQLVAFMRIAGFVAEDVDPRSLPQWPVWFQHRQSLQIGSLEFEHQDDLELARQFKKPVLLVKGAGSSPYLHQIIDVLAEQMPQARVVTYPGGHAAHIVSMRSFLADFSAILSESKLQD